MATVPDQPQHLAYPLRLLADGTFETVEQDTLDDVRQCVQVLLNTPVGVRPLAPQVGIPDYTFQGVDPDELQELLEDQEDRAVITITTSDPAQTGDDGEQSVIIDVELASQADVEQVDG